MTRISPVRAPNPSPMTLTGTNSYILDDRAGHAICIDPGPAIPRHIDAIVQVCGQLECVIEWIAVTHGHPDHASGATLLRQRTGARLAAHSNTLAPDRLLKNNEEVAAGGVILRAIEAPGHSADHLVFYDTSESALFTGDVILGEGYVLIAAPDGDMRAYQQTLRALLRDYPQARTIYPGHGDPIAEPRKKIQEYLQHREARESEIVAALRARAQTISELTQTIYPQLDPKLAPAAAAQVQAHLDALARENRVASLLRGEKTLYSLTD